MALNRPHYIVEDDNWRGQSIMRSFVKRERAGAWEVKETVLCDGVPIQTNQYPMDTAAGRDRLADLGVPVESIPEEMIR